MRLISSSRPGTLRLTGEIISRVSTSGKSWKRPQRKSPTIRSSQAPSLTAQKITHNRYQQLMPHNRGFGNTRRLRPSLLETQLADKIDKLAALALQRLALYCRQIVMILQLVFYNSLGILTAVNTLIKVINQLKFPFGCQIMAARKILFSIAQYCGSSK